MSETNNALRVRFHGMSLLQTQDGAVLSDYFDPGEDLYYPTLTNAQANYISVELKKRIGAAVLGLIDELRESKAAELGETQPVPPTRPQKG